MKVKKDFVLNHIISGLEQGEYPSKIAEKLNISKQHIGYYIRRLKEQGIIEKKGYGVWEVVKRSKESTKVALPVRGHAFMWKVKLPKKFDWKKIIEEKKINHKLIYKGTPSILFRDRKIWLGKENIIIYEPESFLGNNSIETRRYAIEHLLSLLRALESKLGVYLRYYDGYRFKVTRQHYSLIKNDLAIQCNKEGQKIQVYNKKGLWFLIDNSYNLDEAETVHPKDALVDNLGVQRYFNEHKETKFQVTPLFLLEALGKITMNQETLTNNLNSYGTHIKAHTESIKALSKAIPELTKMLKETKEENKQLKQRRMSEYY